ncbi:MAG: M20/M25/M40 family metallo-hydrolase [Planctomycetota bacterium]
MLNKTRRAHASALVVVSIAGLLTGCAPTLDSIRGGPAYAVISGERAPMPDIDMGSEATLVKIYEEGTANSQVMDLLTYICVDIGPRLTGSENSERAERWAVDMLDQWGAENARRERWGEIAAQFNRGNASAQIVSLPDEDDIEDDNTADAEPTVVRDLAFTTLAWTNGTDGPVTGPVVRMPDSLVEADTLGDDLTGAWVLIPPYYSDRRGVRSVGFQMRERHDLRHQIRTGELDPFSPEAVEEAEEAAEAENPKPTLAEGQSTWIGSMSYRGSPLPATLVLQRNADGKVTEGVFSIEQFHSGPIAEIAEDGATLAFAWPNPMGQSDIELTLDSSGALAGSSGDGDFPIRLTADDAATRDDAEVLANTPETIIETPEQVLAHVLERDPAGFISTSKDDRVWTTRTSSWKEAPIEDLPRDVELNVTGPDYYYINSMLADGQDVTVRADLPHTVRQGPIDVYNVIADIPGTDLPDEVVIISAHLDSWDGPGSQGTVDNGTGVAVMMEAARILAAVDAKPKRTIRLILWTGEEQGLWGAREYVDQLTLTEKANISVMLNDDGGTNYQGGYPAASVMVPMLAAATGPVNGLFFSQTDYDRMINDDDPDNDELAGFMNINIRDTGRNLQTHRGSDHAAFNAVGIPGLYTDEVGRADYRYAWHTQRDRVDQAIPEYLEQSAVAAAITAYRLANAPTILPRDPGPEEEEEQTAMAD